MSLQTQSKLVLTHWTDFTVNLEFGQVLLHQIESPNDLVSPVCTDMRVQRCSTKLAKIRTKKFSMRVGNETISLYGPNETMCNMAGDMILTRLWRNDTADTPHAEFKTIPTILQMPQLEAADVQVRVAHSAPLHHPNNLRELRIGALLAQFRASVKAHSTWICFFLMSV